MTKNKNLYNSHNDLKHKIYIPCFQIVHLMERDGMTTAAYIRVSQSSPPLSLSPRQ